MFRKYLPVILVSLILILSLGGCGNGNADESGNNSSYGAGRLTHKWRQDRIATEKTAESAMEVMKGAPQTVKIGGGDDTVGEQSENRPEAVEEIQNDLSLDSIPDKSEVDRSNEE